MERVSIDIDTRLRELWALIWEICPPEDVSGKLGDFLRAAYARGYADAMNEVKEGRPGELARANGYTTKEEA